MQQPQQPPPPPPQQRQSPASASQPPPAGSPQQAPPPQQGSPQPVTTIVQISAKPSEEIGVADVLIGSIALIGALMVAALLVGLVTGGIFIALRRRREARDPDSTNPQHTRLDLSTPPNSK